jgi:DNA-binding NtrC family response regulator
MRGMFEPRFLIVDDEPLVSHQLASLIRRHGAEPAVACSVAQAELQLARDPRWTGFVVDIRLPDGSGLDLLRRARPAFPNTPALVLSAHLEPGFISEIYDLRAGYLLKPWDTERVVEFIDQARSREVLRSSVPPASGSADGWPDSAPLLGSSPAMERLRSVIRRVADSSVPVLITGPTGAGKEVVARSLHALSRRATRPFVAINCAAVPSALFESELFGHERGSFTGAERSATGYLARVDGGTLLLDEIGDMPKELQAKLLRVIDQGAFQAIGAQQEQPFLGRVVAATNADSPRGSPVMGVRADLYYRLAVVELRVPPLVSRREDIRELVAHFMSRQPRVIRFTEDALAYLEAQQWPGNVRELRATVERAALLATTDTVDRAELSLMDEGSTDPDAALARLSADLENLPGGLQEKLTKLERAVVDRTLRRLGDNKSAAAAQLGMGRKTVERRARR